LSLTANPAGVKDTDSMTLPSNTSPPLLPENAMTDRRLPVRAELTIGSSTTNNWCRAVAL
jgi:hypothetical protein